MKFNFSVFLNLINTISLAAIVAILCVLLYAGNKVYMQYAHQGVNCREHIKDFDFWIKGNVKKDKNTIDKNITDGKIVSIHQQRLQLKNGKTTCYGTFMAADGEYSEWQGSVEILLDGSVVGNAYLD